MIARSMFMNRPVMHHSVKAVSQAIGYLGLRVTRNNPSHRAITNPRKLIANVTKNSGLTLIHYTTAHQKSSSNAYILFTIADLDIGGFWQFFPW